MQMTPQELSALMREYSLREMSPVFVHLHSKGMKSLTVEDARRLIARGG